MYHYLALANLPIRGKDRHLGRTTIAPKGAVTGFSRDHPMSPDPLYSVQLYIYCIYLEIDISFSTDNISRNVLGFVVYCISDVRRSTWIYNTIIK